ncbi:MAG: hypothetical protein ABF296_10195 [Oceanococcaceae bacterium]
MTDNTTTPRPNQNPHCRPLWPDNLDIPHHLARLQQASCAALTLAHLLHADDALRVEDDPEHKAPTFGEYHRDGLHQALAVVLHDIDARAEWMIEDHTRRKAEAMEAHQ